MTQTETQHCKIEGCKRPYRARGFCVTHFKKWRRGEMPKKSRYKTCGEENCRKALFQFGMCKEHYESWIASKKGGVTSAGAAAPAAETKPAEAAPAEPSPPKDA